MAVTASAGAGALRAGPCADTRLAVRASTDTRASNRRAGQRGVAVSMAAHCAMGKACPRPGAGSLSPQVDPRPGDLHEARGIGGCGKPDLLVQPVGVARDETPAPQALQIADASSARASSRCRPAPLAVPEHVDVAQIRVGGAIGHDPCKAHLTAAIEQAEAERPCHRPRHQLLRNTLGPVRPRQVGVDGVEVHRRHVGRDAERVPASLECTHWRRYSLEAVSHDGARDHRRRLAVRDADLRQHARERQVGLVLHGVVERRECAGARLHPARLARQPLAARVPVSRRRRRTAGVGARHHRARGASARRGWTPAREPRAPAARGAPRYEPACRRRTAAPAMR